MGLRHPIGRTPVGHTPGVCTHRTHTCIGWLKLRIIFTKERPFLGFFCGKWPVKIRHPMGLRHPIGHTLVGHTPGVFTHRAHTCTGWLKLKMILHKIRTISRALLRKMTSKDKASFSSSIYHYTPSCTPPDPTFFFFQLFSTLHLLVLFSAGVLGASYDTFHWKCYILKIYQTQIPRYFPVQIQIVILVEFEIVPWSLSSWFGAFGGIAFSEETVRVLC